MEHLIANSGIHFIIKEIEINPSEPLRLSNGRTLKYSFCETTDFINGTKIFDLLYYNNNENKYIPIDELLTADNGIVRGPNGREKLDEAGLIMMEHDCKTTLFTTYDDDDECVFSINSLQSFRLRAPENGQMQTTAFELIQDKWLPMPMYHKEVDGVTDGFPLGWCRMKMMKIGEGAKKGVERYRLIWAFDTQTANDPLSMLRPYIDKEKADFCLCNKTDLLKDFMSSSEDFHSFSDYIAAILGIDLTKNDISYAYKAFYIYFLNFIRLSGGAPEVTLHDKSDLKIPVDLVLDIGNSRTCGILFERGRFTEGKMLELRNLSKPWIQYENKTFDMRVVFRKADFGNDIVLDEDMFQWKSFVRIGEEARNLIYRSIEDDGLAEKNTNYSSPKRYLWDTKPTTAQWENLTTTDDPFNVMLSNNISVPTLSDLFQEDGTYKGDRLNDENGQDELIDFGKVNHHYSRSSLMTFALIEIFQHAVTQINSVKYREKWGDVDCRRYIRNVIIT